MNPKSRYCRKSIRLKDYDYTQPGEYFITICTHNHECVLGEIIQGEMRLNIFGKIAEKCWIEIPKHFPNVELDEYEILLHALRVIVTGLRLPNHIHGIIILHEKCRGEVTSPTKADIRQSCSIFQISINKIDQQIKRHNGALLKWWRKSSMYPRCVGAHRGFLFRSTVLRLIDLSRTLFTVVSLVRLLVIQ